MKTDVLVPEVGESITQGVIASWLKDNGDQVDEGEDLFELDTDKATLAVPSPAAGVLTIMTQEGAEVAIGQVVAAIESVAGEKRKKEDHKSSIDFEIKLEESQDETAGAQKEMQPPQPKEVTSEAKSAMVLGPAVRRLVEQYGINPLQIAGTGKDGRITKKDIIMVLEKRGYTIDSETGEPIKEKRPEGGVSQEKATRIEPLKIPGRQKRVPMTTIRKRIAENLLIARQTSAHVTTFNEIDMSRVIEIRKIYKESFEKKHGVRLGFMSFFVKACCNALAAFPVVNGWIDGDDIVYNNYYNIGIAVSTERGLIVPVIRDADKLSFADIETKIRSFAAMAQERKIGVEDLTGGTFTITNGGVFGSLLSTPIPNPPQSAILGMHTIQERPCALNGEVVVKPMMYVALTYDHRLIDGREAVSFLIRVKECIEEPERILIDI